MKGSIAETSRALDPIYRTAIKPFESAICECA
jgi:hypothetical protein